MTVDHSKYINGLIVVTLIGLEIYLYQLNIVAIKTYKIQCVLKRAGVDLQLRK